MKSLSSIMRELQPGMLQFWCPGCGDSHHVCVVREGAGPCWGYNGNPDKPTFTPSILVTYNGPDAGQVDEDGFKSPPAVCHSFVNDGFIQFLNDCTHDLAGQTVALPEYPV